MPKQLAVILGMHRSGTSLITKSLEVLGFSLGDNLMPEREDNPKGFFEDVDLVTLNDELLKAGSSRWDTLLLTPDARNIRDEQLIRNAETLLTEKFRQVDKLAIKDPRLCLLLPFWQARFDSSNISAHYIVVHRNPAEVAASLAKRNGFSTRQGLLLDFIYTREMMRFLGDDGLVIDYASFMNDPAHEVNRISNFLNQEADAAALSAFISEFVDRALWHHQDAQADQLDALPALDDLSSVMHERSQDNDVSISDFFSKSSSDLEIEHELLNIEIAKLTDLLHSQEHDLSIRDSRIQSLEADNKLTRAEVEDVAGRLGERERHIELLQQQTDELAEQLSKSNDILNQRDTELARLIETYTAQTATLENERETHKQVRDQLTATVEGLEEQLSDERERTAGLTDKVSELSEVQAEQLRHLDDYDRIVRDIHGSISFRLGRALTFPIRKPFTILILPLFQQHPPALRMLGFVRQCFSHPIRTLQLFSFRRARNFYKLLTARQDLIDQVVTNYEESFRTPEDKQRTSTPAFEPDEIENLRLSLPTSDEPLVSVLIPVYNQLEYTLKCLQSIAEHKPEVAFEVVVADDCSTDATQQVLARINGLRVVRNPENLKFLLSCNRAVDFCRGKYVFLLNNDTVVSEGWLDTLMDVFETRPDAGLVGSKLVYPDGRLQEAGGIVWQDGSAWNFGRLQDAEAAEFNYVRETDYISGAAIMFPRELFLELGKFDECLAPAYYEDTDLAFRVRQAGRKVYYQPSSVVVHFEGISHGTDETDGLKKYQVANHEKFAAKWSDVLAGHYPNAQAVFVARERAQEKTTILVIDHYVPHFDKDAGSRSTFLYLKLLCQAGCNVKFIGDNFYRHEPYTSALQQMGIEVLYGDYYSKHWKNWLEENSRYIDVIYLMRPHIAEAYIDTINALPDRPRTIYFGHDLHYLRLERQALLAEDSKLQTEADSWREKEFTLFDKVDVIYYPSVVEVDEIKKSRPDLPVKAIPLYPFETFRDDDVTVENRSGMLFVGGFNHPPNADGLTWFIESVLPRIVTAIPDICLNVVGSNMPKEISALDSEHVRVHGYLTDEELENLYQSVQLSVVPLRFGAGIKGKVLEAMDHGVPVVTTQVGAEGIPDSEDCLVIEDESGAMADAIINVYNNRDLLNAHASQARATLHQSFSTQAVLEIIADDFMIQVP